MPDGARWAELPDSTYLEDGTLCVELGPILFPQITVASAGHHGYGRPRIEESRPDRAEFVARGVDVLGMTEYELARVLYSDGVPAQGAKSKVTRDLGAGRARLAADGVLPWAAFPNGPLARSEWWLEDAFAGAMDTWHREAILHPQTPPRPLMQRTAEALRDLAAQYVEGISIPLPRSMRDAALRELDANPWRWTG